MITSTQLFTAAGTIASAASTVNRLASATGDIVLRDLRRQAASQFQSHAIQVLSWARMARAVEERDEEVPPAMTRRIEAATREFLAVVEG